MVELYYYMDIMFEAPNCDSMTMMNGDDNDDDDGFFWFLDRVGPEWCNCGRVLIGATVAEC